MHAGRRLVGADTEVPLVSGGRTRYLNLDSAASTPPLREVAEAVNEFLPWYSSVHRGAGFKSRVATMVYESAREAVRVFVGGRLDDAVIFTRNTTDALNLLGTVLPPTTRILSFDFEHHANLLAWHGHDVRYLGFPASWDDLLERLRDALLHSPGRTGLVVLTGASNVTGEMMPIAEAAALAHEHGARLLVDAAQLAPHCPLDMVTTGIDYLTLSGHKMYAPFGVGALVGRPDWLDAGPPFLRGGGAVEFVTLDEVLWKQVPDRQEAGSPNVIGAMAMAASCRTLADAGMEGIARAEERLTHHALKRLTDVAGVDVYAMWDPPVPRVGIVSFNLAPFHHSLLAEILSAEYGIGVRHGCFCAHPLLLHLLRIPDAGADRMRAEIRQGIRLRVPGAVRASFGIDTVESDVDRLVGAVQSISRIGPRWNYRVSEQTGEYDPDPDPREWPRFEPRARAAEIPA
jgi:selenocysteine lyase/cysteine desulfurase